MLLVGSKARQILLKNARRFIDVKLDKAITLISFLLLFIQVFVRRVFEFDWEVKNSFKQ